MGPCQKKANTANPYMSKPHTNGTKEHTHSHTFTHAHAWQGHEDRGSAGVGEGRPAEVLCE